jgi:hypothetical protein
MRSHQSAHLFRAAAEARDLDALVELLAEDVVLHSPVTFRHYTGCETVGILLRLVADTFEDLHYTDQLEGPDDVHALVFRARVGDRELEGVDLLRLDADGLIADLTAIIRPLSGVAALAQAIAPKVQAAGLKAAA